MDREKWFQIANWQERWTVIEPAGEGKDALGFVVRSAAGTDPGPRFLKVVKRQDEWPARRALYQEAKILAALAHSRIPGFIESNAHCHAKPGRLQMYLVTDYVAGPTVRQALHPGSHRTRLNLDSALDLIEPLLDALTHCHNHGYVHRDLVERNIILRGGNLSDPVLVDFSRSRLVNDNVEPGAPSSEWERRVELTRLARLFLALLVGHNKLSFRDWYNRPPHRRPVNLERLQAAADHRPEHLIQFFDRAFTDQLGKGFVTAADFRAALGEMRSVQAQKMVAGNAFAERLAMFFAALLISIFKWADIATELALV
jgi:serine/threonine protein kinase